MKKRILAVILAAVLVLCLLPTAAFAANAGEVWVNGVNIVTDPDHSIECGTGTAVYDPEEKTLTLTDAQITNANLNSKGIDVAADIDLNIILVGSNTSSKNILANGNLTISGKGSLNVTLTSFDCIASNGNLVIDGATLILSTSENGGGILSEGSVTIQNEADVTSSGLYYGIQATNGVSVSDSKVSAASTETNCNAILVTAGAFTATNSEVTASSYYPAIFANSGITLSGSKVDATSTNDAGIFTPRELTISNSSDVTVKGSAGLVSNGDMTITDSKVTIPESNVGISARANLEISGSELSIKSKNAAIDARNAVDLENCTGTIQNVGVPNGDGGDIIYGTSVSVMGKLNISGAKTNLTIQGSDGIYCEDDITFSGGKLSAIGLNGAGIETHGVFTFNSGELNAKGTGIAISSYIVSPQADLTTAPTEIPVGIVIAEDYADVNRAKIANTGWVLESYYDGALEETAQRWAFRTSFVSRGETGPLTNNNYVESVTIKAVEKSAPGVVHSITSSVASAAEENPNTGAESAIGAVIAISAMALAAAAATSKKK